jgi:hypothetical protein
MSQNNNGQKKIDGKLNISSKLLIDSLEFAGMGLLCLLVFFLVFFLVQGSFGGFW